jgi:hypothetical protein
MSANRVDAVKMRITLQRKPVPVRVRLRAISNRMVLTRRSVFYTRVVVRRCVFKWHHEYCVEVDVPISHVLSFITDFNNWPNWMDQCESFQIDKAKQTETVIKAKIKNKNAYFPVLMSEIESQKKYRILIKVPFFYQISLCHFQEISTTKTKITIHTSVVSFLTPFFKSHYRKNVENQYPKLLKALLESVEKGQC